MLSHGPIQFSLLTSNLATACFWKPSRVNGNRCAGRGTRASKSDTSSNSVTAHLTALPSLSLSLLDAAALAALLALLSNGFPVEPFLPIAVFEELLERGSCLRSLGVLSRCSVIDYVSQIGSSETCTKKHKHFRALDTIQSRLHVYVTERSRSSNH